MNVFLCFYDLIGYVCSCGSELIKGAVSGNLAKNRHGEVSTELSKKKKHCN